MQPETNQPTNPIAPIPIVPPAISPMQRTLAAIRRHPKKTAAITLLVLLILSAGSYAAYKHYSKQPGPPPPPPAAPAPPPEPPKAVTKPSPLTGIELPPETADRPILAVVIENHPDARPQSGLAQAGVVYEALAEGGITRFLAFFLDQRPAAMGPIRSVRTYFVDWALEFDAPVAHVGGNADALDLIGPLGLKSLNQFAHGNDYYRTKDRYAPHNAYTNSDLMDNLLASKGFNKPATLKPSPRKPDTKLPEGQAAANPSIKINYSYNGYQVEYRYDPTNNEYLRFLAGAPHIDNNTGTQIRVKNVVVQYMPTSYGSTRIGEQTVMMGTPGSGKAVVFRDGSAVAGTWTKPDHRSRTRLLDPAGTDIPLNSGNTWYAIVPDSRTASY